MIAIHSYRQSYMVYQVASLGYPWSEAMLLPKVDLLWKL